MKYLGSKSYLWNPVRNLLHSQII